MSQAWLNTEDNGANAWVILLENPKCEKGLCIWWHGHCCLVYMGAVLSCSQELAKGKMSLPSFFCVRSAHARSRVLCTRGTFVPRPAGLDGNPTGRLNVSLNLEMEMVWKRVSHGVKKLAVLSSALWRGGDVLANRSGILAPLPRYSDRLWVFWSYSALTLLWSWVHQAVLAERHLAHVV